MKCLSSRMQFVPEIIKHVDVQKWKIENNYFNNETNIFVNIRNFVIPRKG